MEESSNLEKTYAVEEKEMLQSIKETLERIETVLLRIEEKQKRESAEEFYKAHGIIQTFA